MIAVAVAVRGPGSKSESSPNISPGPSTREQVLAAVGGGARDLHLALDDEEQPVTRVALAEHDVAARHRARGHRIVECVRRVLVERGEQRQAVARVPSTSSVSRMKETSV